MLDVRKSFVIVGCVAVGFVLSAGPGLVARAAEPERWAQAIAPGSSSRTASEISAQRRIAELEQKVKELEAARGSASSAEQATELAAAIARTEQLEARNRALSLEKQGLTQSLFETPAHGGCEQPDQADAREQLRYWAQRLRDGESNVRRLSSEWNSALQVILRRERQLDPNPWREQ